MGQTVLRGTQVLDGSIQRADLDVSTAGQAVVRKILAGSGITLIQTGVDDGTGDVTIIASAGTGTGDFRSDGSVAGTGNFITSGFLGLGTAIAPQATLDLKGVNSTAVLGSEKITATADRDFSSSTGNWTGTGWSIASGVLSHTAGANAVTLINTALDAAAVAGGIYQVVFTIATTVAGTLTVSVGGGSSVVVGKQINTDYQTMVVDATGTGPLTFTPDATWVGTLDDVSVKLITPSAAIEIMRNSAGTIENERRSGALGQFNTFIGVGTGRANTTGYSNLGVGWRSLYRNTSSQSNVAVGQESLSNNTIGSNNSAFGFQALLSNTVGTGSVAVGYQALLNNTSGACIAIGYQALLNSLTGSNNTAIGNQPLYSNTTGNSNIAIGNQSLYFNTTGFSNIGMGYRSLYRNTVGQSNIAIGDNSLENNTTGSQNLVYGFQSLASNTTGSNNLALGALVLNSNITGNNNTAAGYQALTSLGVGDQNTSFGYYSLLELGSTQTAGAFNVGTTYTIKTLGTTNFTLIGAASNTVGLVFTASGVGIGTGTANPYTYNNTAIGPQAGRGIIHGSGNTIIGGATGLPDGLTNNIILADGVGNQRLNIDSTGTVAVSRLTATLSATPATAPTLASASSISPTTRIVFVSGTTAINTIVPPSPISLGGGEITLIPTGLWTINTAGNISRAYTAVVGIAVNLAYDAATAKWYPASSSNILITTEANLGSTPRRSGYFTITGAELTVGKPVIITKAVGPYTNKGSLADESEMDNISVSASVTSGTTIKAFWTSATRVRGNHKFNYQVSA